MQEHEQVGETRDSDEQRVIDTLMTLPEYRDYLLHRLEGLIDEIRNAVDA